MDERLSYRGTKKLPEIFSESEIQLILKTIYESKDYFKDSSKCPKEYGEWLKCRDLTLVAATYILGGRPKEICCLKFDDFDLRYMTVKIRGENNKNKKDRVIPIPKILFTFFKEYFKFPRDKFWHGSQFLFPAFGKNTPISSERYKHIFREKCLKPAGLWNLNRESKAQYRTIYKLRHSRASHILNKQVRTTGKPDIFMLSNLLGHSDIRSTMVYLHTDQSYQNYMRDNMDI